MQDNGEPMDITPTNPRLINCINCEQQDICARVECGERDEYAGLKRKMKLEQADACTGKNSTPRVLRVGY